jgi:hypothetical protein
MLGGVCAKIDEESHNAQIAFPDSTIVFSSEEAHATDLEAYRSC